MSDLPPGWEWTTLYDVASWGSGGTPKRTVSRYYGGDLPWAVIGDLNDGVVTDTAERITDEALANSSAKLVPQGAVLLAMYGSIGKLGITGRAMATNQAIAFAQPHPGVLNAQYLFHYLYSQRQALAAVGKGATQKNISQTVLRTWPIPLAPRAEQERIVAAIEEHLSRLDAAEAVLDSAATKAEVLRRVALRDGFRLNAPVVALADVAQVVSGQTPKGLETAENGSIPFFKVGDMNTADEGVLRRSRTMLSEEAIALLGLHLRPPGTVVFPKRGGAIATNKKRVLGCQAAFDLNTMGVIAGKDLDGQYLRWWFETLDLASLSDGSNVPQINHGDIAPLGIPVPPLDEQRRVVAALAAAEGHLMRLSRQVELARSRAGALRRAILAAAFSGELVPQDPDDEPASVLLERIRAERARAERASVTPTKRTRKAKAS